MRKFKFQKGFSLLELLLVVGILSIISLVAFGAYRDFVKNSGLDSIAKGIIFDLKGARAKAMTAENNLKWGAHFINSTDDYYEIFSTPTDYSSASTTIDSTVYLGGNISFSEPAVSSTIIFAKIKGTISATTTITVISESNSKTITVTPIGNIY
ncbi:MAG: type II secretion system protein [Patescibacteria group bacterium]